MRKFASLLTVLMLLCTLASAQNRTISGTVVDEKGDALPGASIRIKNTRSGVAADTYGRFFISAKTGDILVVSGAGIETTESPVGAGNTISIAVKRTITTGTEVIVTALGVRKQPREIGYSAAIVTGNELNQAKVINPVTGLTGKVSGLQIQTADNSVNPTVRVTLRGNRSILGNNQALIIVDNVQVDNAYLARINPNDIESMNVLKGASASAIYGSNASNGVLVVTTKRGTRGKPRITFSSTVQMETISYMPKLQDRFGSYGGEGYDDYLAVHFPEDPIKVYYPYENQSYGPEYNGQLVPLGGPVRIYRADGTFFDSTNMVPYSAVKNGKRKFFDKGVTYQNNVSFSSGDANSLFYMSFQNVDVHGIVPGDKSGRNNLRINGMKQYGKFQVDYSTSYSLEKIDQAGGSYFQDRPVYWTVINSPQHVDLRKFKNWRTDPFANPNGYFNAYYGNPWWQIDQARNVTRNNNFVGNVRLSLQITNWLEASYTVGYSRNDQSFKATKGGFVFGAYEQTDPWQAGAIPSSVKVLQPSLTDILSYSNRISGDALLTAKKSFGDFTTKLIVGNSVNKRKERFIADATGSLIIPGLYNINYRQGEPTVNEGVREEGLLGVFGDLTVGFRNYLFLHGTGRNDWNSKLAPANRSFFYESGDLSFVFSDAIPFFKNSKILSLGKLRGAYSKVGQVSIDPYQLDNLAFVSGGFPYGAQAGFTISNNFANPGLKPEFTKEQEVGLELGFLKNRIYFTATYFNTKTTNQTIPSQISSATGFTSATINLGSMTNKGWELDLRLTPLLNIGPVKWNMTANFTHITNRVGQDLGGEISLGNSVYAIPGKPYPYVKATDWVRDDQGRIIVDKNTGFPTKAGPLAALGTTVAPTKIGLTTSFTYKSLTLSAVADARFGAVVFNSIGSSLDFTGISWYTAQTGRQPFVIPNSVIDDGTGKYIPNTSVATVDANWRFWANTWNQAGSNYVNSADFWKIREISLNYDLPRKWIDKLKVIQQASLTLSGRNLFMFRPKDNVWTDPEFSDTNNLNSNAIGSNSIFETPPTRIFGATLNITF
ncbi:MAG TPA: SusC/RagA family TonB-linked outer membrane protein [Chitinophagaceae bacterium]|nr:SusC/RagA family TonB-linked outer membrane protein [Chitinophagaceae bacterium]